MTIIFETNYMVHEGGTKFYETVLIWTQDKQDPCLIKRWGPIGKRMGHGQTKVEYHESLAAARRAQMEICGEKLKERPGKGRYEYAAFSYGLHDLPKMGGVGRMSKNLLCAALVNHYSEAEAGEAKLRNEILWHFEIDEHGDMELPLDDDIVEEAPEEPIIRSATWGSW